MFLLLLFDDSRIVCPANLNLNHQIPPREAHRQRVPEYFKTKSAVVAYVKKSFADGATVIKEHGDKGILEMVVEAEEGRTVPMQDLAYGVIEHAGEHYG